MRARILGPALPPVNLEYVPVARRWSPAHLQGNIFCFGPPNQKMRSSSHDSRSPDLPVKILEPDGMATATLRELLRFRLRLGSPRCDESRGGSELVRPDGYFSTTSSSLTAPRREPTELMGRRTATSEHLKL